MFFVPTQYLITGNKHIPNRMPEIQYMSILIDTTEEILSFNRVDIDPVDNCSMIFIILVLHIWANCAHDSKHSLKSGSFIRTGCATDFYISSIGCNGTWTNRWDSRMQYSSRHFLQVWAVVSGGNDAAHVTIKRLLRRRHFKLASPFWYGMAGKDVRLRRGAWAWKHRMWTLHVWQRKGNSPNGHTPQDTQWPG